ncbi:MAG: hypothetical protein Ct9H90mP27_6550 [Gammaproteobacteria bacterium]|nr:MAG: hypothetical protein Ct9H90mP27_6550 [Gammaproteobacteria bacterium]
MTTIKVHPDKIRDIIGKGGATIRGIVEETGAEVDIDDDGLFAFMRKTPSLKMRQSKSELYNCRGRSWQNIQGKVERIVDFGAFVNILPGKDGFSAHIADC